MITKKEYRYPLLLLIYFFVLLVVSTTTPITHSEAWLFFEDIDRYSSYLMHLGYSIVPAELGVRLAFLLLGFVNILLFYQITKPIFTKEKDRILSTAIYMLLPGVIASTSLASDATIVSTLTLLFVYAYQHKYYSLILFVFFMLCFVHWTSFVLYLSTAFYAIFNRDKLLLFLSSLALFLYLAINIPFAEMFANSHILETIATYAAVFSPFLFVYLFYSLYRGLLRGSRDIVWYLSFLALFISLIISFWYRVKITDFSPYIMIGIPVAVSAYYASLRVRMKRFQKGYRLLFWIVTLSLLLSSFSIIMHQPIYRVLGKAHYSVVAPVYEPYDKVQKILLSGKRCTEESNAKTLMQMRFYGIKRCF